MRRVWTRGRDSRIIQLMPGHLPGAAKLPRRMLLTTLATGFIGSSVCAVPTLPAGAIPAPAKPPAPPKHLTDRAAFWALPVLETGMDLGSPTWGGDIPGFVPVTLDQKPVREAALEAIRTLRRELFAREDLLYQGMPLRTMLRKQRNINDAEAFASHATWNSNRELASFQRIAELTALYSPNRPAGGRGSSMKFKDSQAFALKSEFIAKGDASTVYNLLLQTWGRDQVPTLIANDGKYREGCLELWWMLNIESSQLGFAVTAAGGNLHATFINQYSAAGTPSSALKAPLKGSFRVDIALKPDRVNGFALHAPKLMIVGESADADVRTTAGVRVSEGLATQAPVGYLDTTPEGHITAGTPGQYTIETFVGATKVDAPIEVRRFKDVPVKHKFFRDIEDVAVAGIAHGRKDGTYLPSGLVTRGAMAAFLYRTAGSPKFKPPTKSAFRDVPTRHQFYKEISWLSAKQITTGKANGKFSPGSAVTRGEMAAFLYRLAGSPNAKWSGGESFVDVTASAPFARAIRFMDENGLSRGWGVDPRRKYRPKELVKREAMAAFLSRYRDQAASDGFS